MVEACSPHTGEGAYCCKLQLRHITTVPHTGAKTFELVVPFKILPETPTPYSGGVASVCKALLQPDAHPWAHPGPTSMKPESLQSLLPSLFSENLMKCKVYNSELIFKEILVFWS